MKLEQARAQIAAYGRRMITAGLSRGTGGNLSILDPECGLVAISPSGLDYFETAPEDVVVTDLEGHIVEGVRKPSTELGLHLAFYRRKPGIRAVVHTHSPYCTTLACMRVPLEAMHLVFAGAGCDRVPCAPYATFGTPELAAVSAEACGEANAVLLASHGLVACGEGLPGAFSLAENLEFCAELQWRCLCAGGMQTLTHAQLEAIRGRFRSYGQQTGPVKFLKTDTFLCPVPVLL